ncbi:hypothetical protein C2845_PM01G27680 [Panicum miliaceum]|uniref:Uncharacterized protein n=1 Tax=Panicum miliaceum TaxID=4540 RepID=A0A3L6TJ92_PANMI|nr:hypothetical protein C2845_PM01G27680 [Panicum miliaceum]
MAGHWAVDVAVCCACTRGATHRSGTGGLGCAQSPAAVACRVQREGRRLRAGAHAAGCARERAAPGCGAQHQPQLDQPASQRAGSLARGPSASVSRPQQLRRGVQAGQQVAHGPCARSKQLKHSGARAVALVGAGGNAAASVLNAKDEEWWAPIHYAAGTGTELK